MFDIGALIGDTLVAGGLAMTALSIRFASRQVREANASRQLEAFGRTLDEIGSPELRSLRADVLSRPVQDFSALSAPQIDSARRLAVAYDRIAIYVRLGLDSGLLREFHGSDMEQVWDRVAPVVYKIRESRPDYCSSIEGLIRSWRDASPTI
jgi:hypothetical protein